MNKLFITLICLCQITFLHARQPYHAKVTVNTDTANVSASNLVDLSNDLSTSNLEDLFVHYTPVSPVSFGINLRGLLANAAFAANSTTLVVVIPNLDITVSFDGGTRDQSLILFKDFIKEGKSLAKILKGYRKYSPIDPIAGNPNSLMAQMADADYALAHLSLLDGCDCCWNSQPVRHQFQLGADIGRTFSDGYDATIINLPTRYSYSPNASWALILDAPLAYIRNGGASSVVGSVGLGARLPVTCAWILTPILRLGAGGSLDLCTSGGFITGGLTSTYNYKMTDYVLSMVNYAGYFTSSNLWLTGLNFNYHLHNTVFKNGLSLTSCKGYTLCKRPINFNVTFVDSYFAGETLFIRHYDEVGISLITTHFNRCLDYDCLSAGFTYKWGQKNYKGYFLNMIYQF